MNLINGHLLCVCIYVLMLKITFINARDKKLKKCGNIRETKQKLKNIQMCCHWQHKNRQVHQFMKVHMGKKTNRTNGESLVLRVWTSRIAVVKIVLKTNLQFYIFFYLYLYHFSFIKNEYWGQRMGKKWSGRIHNFQDPCAPSFILQALYIHYHKAKPWTSNITLYIVW